MEKDLHKKSPIKRLNQYMVDRRGLEPRTLGLRVPALPTKLTVHENAVYFNGYLLCIIDANYQGCAGVGNRTRTDDLQSHNLAF